MLVSLFKVLFRVDKYNGLLLTNTFVVHVI